MVELEHWLEEAENVAARASADCVAYRAELKRLRVDDSSDVRVSAVRALQQGVECVPPEKACKALMEAASHDDAWDVRAAAVRMRALRRRDRPAVRGLRSPSL